MVINGNTLSTSKERLARDFVDFLVGKGVTKQGACGMVANNYRESVLRADNAQDSSLAKIGYTDEQYVTEVDNGTYIHPTKQVGFDADGIGFGWAQWTSKGRKSGLLNFAKNIAHTSIADAFMQWEYLYWELMNGYTKVLKVMKNPDKTPEDCAKYIMIYFEAPKNQSESNQEKRATIAREFYDQIYGTEKKESEEKNVLNVPVRPQFAPRTHKPTAGEKHIKLYNNSKNGGISTCINGKPTDPEANVLNNCVGYACGRFNEIYDEITGYNGIKFPKFNCNAENFIERAKSYGLTVGQIPMRGAIGVFQKGNTLSGDDGAGHVFVVESVNSATDIIVSESGYNSYNWRLNNRKGSKYGFASAYKLRGFIYNPAIYDNPYPIPTETLKKGVKNESVKWLQFELGIECDGSFGGITDKVFRERQKQLGLTVDGKCGGNSRKALITSI